MPQSDRRRPSTLSELIAPPPLPSGRVPLPTTPLRQTNPIISRLADLATGFLGLSDPFAPEASVETGIGAIGSMLPLGMALGMLRSGRVAKPIKAYHGSPHDFDKFSLEKIGTGEGAQSYGHGLYFAENPAVAEEYRKQFAARAARSSKAQNAIGVAIDLIGGDGVQIANRSYKPSQVLELAQDIEDKIVTADLLPKWAQDRLGVTLQPRTYEVAIHADPDEFLDWDLPLSQQSERIQEAILKTRPQNIKPVQIKPGQYGISRVMAGGYGEVQPGIWGASPEEAIRNYWTDQASQSGAQILRSTDITPELSAETLRKAGIKGIRYKDAGSRGPAVTFDVGAPRKDFGPYSHFRNRQDAEAHLANLKKHGFADAEIRENVEKQTSNYVVFDDAIIDIMKKYGVALPVAAAIKAWQDRQATDRKPPRLQF